MLGALSVVIGGPILLAWRLGWLSDSREHLGVMLGGGIVLFVLLVALLLSSALVATLSTDFLVPLLALERLRVLEAWRRLLRMMRNEKGAYAGYVLFKIVLAVGSAVLFGIAAFVAVIVPFIVLGLVVALVPLSGINWNAFTTAVAIALGCLALAGLVYALSLISAPSMVFFQAYSMHFLGSRYRPLAVAMASVTRHPGTNEMANQPSQRGT